MDFPMHSDTYATQPVTLLRPPGDDWSAMQGKQLTAIVTHLRRVVSILPPVFEPARGFSEFSQCFEPGQVDSLFADGFE